MYLPFRRLQHQNFEFIDFFNHWNRSPFFRQLKKKTKQFKWQIILCICIITLLLFKNPGTDGTPSRSVEENNDTPSNVDETTSETTSTTEVSTTTIEEDEEEETSESDIVARILLNAVTFSRNSSFDMVEEGPPFEYNHTHAWITSAYYYDYSKSLGPNALAMIIVMSQHTLEKLEDYQLTIVSTSSNGAEMITNATIKVESPEETSCEYVMTFVQATTLSNPEKLEIASFGNRVEVPFRRPRTWSHAPVIMCIAPQFVAEKWQLFLMNIHVIRRFGGHMHVYVTSMVKELFDTLKVYESWGSVTVDHWIRMKFNETYSNYTEPMTNVEWRNQAGAQTDCLLQYKEVADFIAFIDIDDILIPRYSLNYHQEFSAHFNSLPTYHSIFYQKRDVYVPMFQNVTDFNFRDLFSLMLVSNVTEYGKSIVNPLRYNSTWIHHSMKLPRHKIFPVPNTEIIHIKELPEESFYEDPKYKVPHVYGTSFEPIIREADVITLDKDYSSSRGSQEYRETADRMIDHDFYQPIIFQCYNESFYHPYFVEKKGFDQLCPNADDCYIPQRPDIKCVHSDAEYVSGPEMQPITFHYAIRPTWSEDIGCYQ